MFLVVSLAQSVGGVVFYIETNVFILNLKELGRFCWEESFKINILIWIFAAVLFFKTRSKLSDIELWLDSWSVGRY